MASPPKGRKAMVKEMKKDIKNIVCSDSFAGINFSRENKKIKSHPNSNKGMALSFSGGKTPGKFKLLGVVEEPYGHKGTVWVRHVNGNSSEIEDLKSVVLLKNENEIIYQDVFEVRTYRKGRFLVRFCGLKWRNEIEGYKDFVLAV